MKIFKFYSRRLKCNVEVIGGKTHKYESVTYLFKQFREDTGALGFNTQQIHYLKHCIDCEKISKQPHPLFALWELEGYGHLIEPFLNSASLSRKI